MKILKILHENVAKRENGKFPVKKTGIPVPVAAGNSRFFPPGKIK
jgi:hypothetical protein